MGLPPPRTGKGWLTGPSTAPRTYPCQLGQTRTSGSYIGNITTACRYNLRRFTMIEIISGTAPTKREWNGRDDIHCHYMGRIPLTEPFVALTLNWKRDKHSQLHLIGRYRLDMAKLVSEGYARKVPGWYILRFQRTGNRFEVAANRSSRALPLPAVSHDYKA
jgi:hypothetical protein